MWIAADRNNLKCLEAEDAKKFSGKHDPSIPHLHLTVVKRNSPELTKLYYHCWHCHETILRQEGLAPHFELLDHENLNIYKAAS